MKVIKFCIHKIPKRKKFRPTKCPEENILNPRNTHEKKCLDTENTHEKKFGPTKARWHGGTRPTRTTKVWNLQKSVHLIGICMKLEIMTKQKKRLWKFFKKFLCHHHNNFLCHIWFSRLYKAWNIISIIEIRSFFYLFLFKLKTELGNLKPFNI